MKRLDNSPNLNLPNSPFPKPASTLIHHVKLPKNRHPRRTFILRTAIESSNPPIRAPTPQRPHLEAEGPQQHSIPRNSLRGTTASFRERARYVYIASRQRV